MRKLISIGLCSAFLAVFTACNWIDPELNVDPNQPATADYNLVLPVAQASTAYVQGGDLGRYASVLTQHNIGLDRQHLGIYNYQFTESDVNNAWEGIYSGPLSDLKILMDRAEADGTSSYLGVFQVMFAYNMVMVSDLWGDVPSSDAFRGAAATQPKYDTQEAVYTAMNALLDRAITNLTGTASVLKPGADDFVYGGNLSKWTKAAWALKARMAIHRVKRDAAAGAVALDAVSKAMASNADDMQFSFGAAETEGNPWYQFNTQRGDIAVGPKLAELMNATSDPRRPFYGVPDSTGALNTESAMGDLYSAISSAVPMLTFTEMKFIEAEAKSRVGDGPGAHAAYVAAVRASLERSGVSAADVTAYLAQPSVDPGAANLTLANIMTQKYIAMYTQPESFSDWRRSGVPALTPVSGSNVPRRFPYAQSERLYNGSNMPAGLTIFDRVWWDVQ